MEEQEKTNQKTDYDYLEDQINQLKKVIEDSYYRIPKDDFETITRQKITQDITDKFEKKITTWRNWAAVIIGVLSFLGISQVSSILRNLEEKNEKQLKELNQQIDSKISYSQNSKWKELDLSLKECSKELNDRINSQVSIQSSIIQSELHRLNQEVEKAASEQTKIQLSQIKDDIQNSIKRSLRSELISIKQDYDTKRIPVADALNEMEKIIEKAISLGEKTIVSFALEEMIYLAFINYNYEKVVALYNKYKKENIEFTVTGLKNICLSNLLLYEEVYSPVYRENILETFEKTINKQPNHSHAHAIRIALHLIDYKRTTNDKEKENEKMSISKYINGIASSSYSKFTGQVTDYLSLLKGLMSNRIDFIDELNQLVPNEMDELKKNVHITESTI